MIAGPDGLDALRREIDALDDRIHELLMERAKVVERIFAVKNNQGSGKLYPGREAQILRRLLAKHGGRLPKAVIARVWRELLSAFGRMQQPFSVAVLAPERSVSYWDLARRHFGSSTPTTLHRSPQNVLSAVMETPGLIGVLPLPQEEEADPWWPKLVGDTPLPRVVTKLPFFAEGMSAPENIAAFAVTMMEPEPSGEDMSLIALSLTDTISRMRMQDLLREAGLAGTHVASAGEWHLVEVAGFITKGDAKLVNLVKRAAGAIQQAKAIGAYPVPIAPAAPTLNVAKTPGA